MDMAASPKLSNPWFATLDEVDDSMLLQEFMDDYLVDYPPEDMDGLMDREELHYTLSTASECNSSTAAGEINNCGAKRQKNSNDHPSSPKNNINSDSNGESDQHSPGQNHISPSPEEADTTLPSGVTTKPTKRPKRLPEQCQNHIMAERQRRQNLSQLFIALSALIPDLKKMDKTSVLTDAITHMKHLKERVTILEDEKAKNAAESVVVVQRSRVIVDNEGNSSSSNNSHSTGVTQDDLPDIEARFSDRSVLIKVLCRMRPCILPEILSKIEDLHLIVSNASSMPFNTILDITIMTQMGADFDMRPQEVVANLRSIF